MTTGMIFDIKRYAINDGPGIRTAVFFKGCPLACWWCHNPEGQSAQVQLMYRDNRCKSSMACLAVCPQEAITWDDGPITDRERCDDCGKCAEVCFGGAREVVGRKVSVNQIMDEIERDIPFYDQSGGGVTFTGGEPLYQIEFLRDALRVCREKQIRTAVDTSGHTAWANLELVLPLTDLFLYDLKLMDANQHSKYTGVSNKLILNNLTRLSKAGAHIIVRIPFIPGINDGPDNLKMCAAYLAELPTLEGVAFMPYHDIGAAKYQALGMQYTLGEIQAPSDEKIAQAEDLLRSYRLPVIKHPGRSV
jgi:pyruvate formate lyase activating enzyme